MHLCKVVVVGGGREVLNPPLVCIYLLWRRDLVVDGGPGVCESGGSRTVSLGQTVQSQTHIAFVLNGLFSMFCSAG